MTEQKNRSNMFCICLAIGNETTNRAFYLCVCDLSSGSDEHESGKEEQRKQFVNDSR